MTLSGAVLVPHCQNCDSVERETTNNDVLNTYNSTHYNNNVHVHLGMHTNSMCLLFTCTSKRSTLADRFSNPVWHFVVLSSTGKHLGPENPYICRSVHVFKYVHDHQVLLHMMWIDKQLEKRMYLICYHNKIKNSSIKLYMRISHIHTYKHTSIHSWHHNFTFIST